MDETTVSFSKSLHEAVPSKIAEVKPNNLNEFLIYKLFIISGIKI